MEINNRSMSISPVKTQVRTATAAEDKKQSAHKGVSQKEIKHQISRQEQGNAAAAEPKLRELCRDLLSNPVIEDFRLEMPNERDGT